ncbi:MAG TPA: M48 family metalloprotease [Labilithrix sp.]|nr:M48 family metalloprotease [Labilithrix sp.]
MLSLALAAVACSSGERSDVEATKNDRTVGAPDAGAPAADSRSPRDLSDEDAPAKKSVCQTLDYGHTRSNADFYLQFPDDKTALAYARDFLAASSLPPPKEVSHNPRLVSLISDIFEGFRRVFPRETRGLPGPPRIVVVQADGINAFAGYDERPHVDKAPWMFWVHTSVVDAADRSDELEGLFAHELAHLVLRNYLPETRARLFTHYRVPNGLEDGIIGGATDDDPVARRRIIELRNLGNLAGREPVFKALPLSAFMTNEYEELILRLSALRGQSLQTQDCADADAGYRRLKALYEDLVSVHDLTLRLTTRSAQDIAALRQVTTDALRRCYREVNISIFDLKLRNQAASLSPQEAGAYIQKRLDPSTPEHGAAYKALMRYQFERDVDQKSDLSIIDRLLEVVETAHRRMSVLDADPELPIDQLRVYDMEEDSDDAAVRVLRALDRDGMSAGHLFLSELPAPDECVRKVNSGIIPDYGRFIDPHNATCWRWYHTGQLVQALDRCAWSSIGPSTSSASKKSAPRPISLFTNPRVRSEAKTNCVVWRTN